MTDLVNLFGMTGSFEYENDRKEWSFNCSNDINTSVSTQGKRSLATFQSLIREYSLSREITAVNNGVWIFDAYINAHGSSVDIEAEIYNERVSFKKTLDLSKKKTWQTIAIPFYFESTSGNIYLSISRKTDIENRDKSTDISYDSMRLYDITYSEYERLKGKTDDEISVLYPYKETFIPPPEPPITPPQQLNNLLGNSGSFEVLDKWSPTGSQPLITTEMKLDGLRSMRTSPTANTESFLNRSLTTPNGEYVALVDVFLSDGNSGDIGIEFKDVSGVNPPVTKLADKSKVGKWQTVVTRFKKNSDISVHIGRLTSGSCQAFFDNFRIYQLTADESYWLDKWPESELISRFPYTPSTTISEPSKRLENQLDNLIGNIGAFTYDSDEDGIADGWQRFEGNGGCYLDGFKQVLQDTVSIRTDNFPLKPNRNYLIMLEVASGSVVLKIGMHNNNTAKQVTASGNGTLFTTALSRETDTKFYLEIKNAALQSVIDNVRVYELTDEEAYYINNVWNASQVTNYFPYAPYEPDPEPGGATFYVSNPGNVKIDPREHELIIKFKGASNRLRIVNNYNGTSWQYYGQTSVNDKIVLDQVYSYKNGQSIFKETNRGVIELLPHINEIEVYGVFGDFEVTFEFRPLYL
ncbi:hypothetical protein [Pseudobacillus badius]|uniref:hypothetical protein n=1 Tax=Bacillus badius TaxID=1455 RepID=UPI0007B3B324|nr:hypothetical protein [Bacillus badius]KZR58365.1 hypothetical protein A3781_17375 [Bacillus badius]